jgi:hypothetical protein
MRGPIEKHWTRKIAHRTKAIRSTALNHTLPNCGYWRVLGLDDQIARPIQVSRKPREKLSKTGFIMYSKNVRSPVLM